LHDILRPGLEGVTAPDTHIHSLDIFLMGDLMAV